MNLTEMLTAELDPEATVEAWAVLDVIDKLVSKRKEELRVVLLQMAIGAAGEITDSTKAVQAAVNGTEVVCNFRGEGDIDEKAFRQLLANRKIPLKEAFDDKTVEVLNVSKVQALIDTGRVEKAMVDAIRKPRTKVLDVRPSPELRDQLQATRASLVPGS